MSRRIYSRNEPNLVFAWYSYFVSCFHLKRLRNEAIRSTVTFSVCKDCPTNRKSHFNRGSFTQYNLYIPKCFCRKTSLCIRSKVVFAWRNLEDSLESVVVSCYKASKTGCSGSIGNCNSDSRDDRTVAILCSYFNCSGSFLCKCCCRNASLRFLEFIQLYGYWCVCWFQLAWSIFYPLLEVRPWEKEYIEIRFTTSYVSKPMTT